ncbi:hypothetical protein [Parafrankia sp. FMc2]|uniref:hypothetical protein n=1 Tax=Parafrankia sp. FMc2 TaxID=3233196 RepID=UPI0034D66A6E
MSNAVDPEAVRRLVEESSFATEGAILLRQRASNEAVAEFRRRLAGHSGGPQPDQAPFLCTDEPTSPPQRPNE